MKLKNNKVLFIPKDEDSEYCIPRPQPSKQYIPNWFKEVPKEILQKDNISTHHSVKKCIPFLDSLTSGYTQELPCDVYIESSQEDDSLVEYSWAGNFRPLSTREESFNLKSSMPHFLGYSKAEFHWNTFWEPKTPNGYSTFYFHPSNRFDLPFMTHSGIIDTDKWPITGPLPFIIKKGFSGLIPAGTPIYQMLFIKRDNWNSDIQKYSKDIKKIEHSVRKMFSDGYKKQIWSKKEYN